MNRSAPRPGPPVLRPGSHDGPPRDCRDGGWGVDRAVGARLVAAHSAPGSRRQQRKQRKAPGYKHTPVPVWAGTTLARLSHVPNRRSSLPMVRPPASKRS